MGILDRLKYQLGISRPTSAIGDPLARAKSRFLNGIGEQIRLAENPKEKGRRWWWRHGGQIYLQPRYGNRPLFTDQRAYPIASESELIRTLRSFHEAAEAGELDQDLMTARERTSPGPRGPRGPRRATAGAGARRKTKGRRAA